MNKKTKAVAIAAAAGVAVLAVVYKIAHKVAPKASSSSDSAVAAKDANATPIDASSTSSDPMPAAPSTPTKPGVKHGVPMGVVWHVTDAQKHYLKHTYPNFGPYAGKVFWARNHADAQKLYDMYGKHFAKGQTVPPMALMTPSSAALSADPHVVPGAEDPSFTPGAVTVPPPAAPPPLPDQESITDQAASLQKSMQSGADAGASVIDAISTFGDTEPQ